MNIIDIISLIPLLYFGVMGFKKGIIKEIFGLLALLIGILSALKFSYFILTELSLRAEVKTPYLPLFVYCVVFLIAFILVIFVGRLIEKLVKAAQLNITNQLIGMAVGLLKGFILISLFIWLADAAQVFDEVVKTQSISYRYIKDFTPLLVDGFGTILPWFKDLISNIETYFSDIAQRLDTAH